MWVKGEIPTINAKTALIVATKKILHRMLCPYGTREEPRRISRAAPLELENRLWTGDYKQEALDGASEGLKVGGCTKAAARR